MYVPVGMVSQLAFKELSRSNKELPFEDYQTEPTKLEGPFASTRLFALVIIVSPIITIYKTGYVKGIKEILFPLIA